jgi:hypothetical protein
LYHVAGQCQLSTNGIAHYALSGKMVTTLIQGAFKTVRLTKQLWGELAVQSGTFCLLVTSIVLFWRNNALLSAIVAAECVMALMLWHERHDVSFFLALAVFGTLAEMAFTHSGVWQYANPTFLGIPLWFPPAFGTAGLAGQRLARTAAAVWETRERSPDLDLSQPTTRG